ncbi:MAG: beta-galactosidase [Clostridiales bacterium]|nr:beta-galactosidase [Clostridiales bacterium]
MEQLKKIGKLKAKKSSEIKYSKIGLGFEKLDRDVFDPQKAYDKVAECGVKKVRLQSGWQRTEKEKGIYDFEWLDVVVDNFLKRGIEPWICLCYGNSLYTDSAKTVFGAVGCPPIFSDEEKQAWVNYVTAVVGHYEGRVNYFEVWNEPDGKWCWKHGVNAKELGEFTIATAKAVKEANPKAKTIGGVVCMRKLDFLNTALKTGMGKYLDYISFHEYTHDENKVFERVENYRALIKMYNPDIELIQGESGTQSKRGGNGALCEGAWTEEIQAKQLARHTIADLMTDVHFTSYFSCLDMIEALHGDVNNKASYLDYGYFGVLGADFDEDGRSTGEYYKKPSYYVLQNICSLFAGDIKVCRQPIFVNSEYSPAHYENQLKRNEVTTGSFENAGGKAFAYWYPSNIMTTSYHSTITVELYTEYNDIKLVDIMDGAIYEIPEKLIEDKGDGVFVIKELPIKDTPLILTFGSFIE